MKSGPGAPPSYERHVVQHARTPLHHHVGELGHLHVGVLPPLHQVHDGQRGALRHHTAPLPVAVAAFGLLAAPGAPEGLVPGWLDDPELSPGERAEVDEVLLPAAHASVWVHVAVAARAEGQTRRRLTSRSPKNTNKLRGVKGLGGPEYPKSTPVHGLKTSVQQKGPAISI